MFKFKKTKKLNNSFIGKKCGEKFKTRTRVPKPTFYDYDIIVPL